MMASKTERDFKGLFNWRCIGPFRGGRVVAVSGDSQNPATFYFGACAGGVWKTSDGGTYWENISDGYFNTSSIGALEVSEADPNVIYAGTGESTIRIDVSHGDGVYKSVDKGKTWQHIGLSDSRHIGKIRCHPQNPDIVYVAALGHAFGENEERGVFKSTDGGANWRKVLFKSPKAGAVDLSIDKQNPRFIYASIWEAYRNFWQISSGGPDSGLHVSRDGGESWQDISRNKGLPQGLLGKIGVVASPVRSGRVWALIEHREKGGLYRSDDYGDTWNYICADQRLISRAWYYMHLTADSQDADTLYINNLEFWKSIDSGASFIEIATPHGDNHDLWIDPHNSQRMVQGNDGGACVSLNGGATWSSIYNQPTAQFYHLDVDNQKPYRVYGTQQDNSSLSVPSRSPNTSIHWSDCYIAGSAESGYIAVHPKDPNIVFVGAIGSSPGGGNALQRYDHKTKQIRLVTTWPEAMTGYGSSEHKYRFAWTYPLFFSPHDANTIYIGGNHVFRSSDEGQSWQKISPDLSRQDPEKLKPTGGPINLDAVGAEVYATVFSLTESPHEKGLLYAGTDDGLVHLSRDGGATWENITPKDLPEWSMVSIIEVSTHEKATVYLSAIRHKLDDYQPYIYKSSDYGKTWKKMVKGLPHNDFIRVIREDPHQADILYAGGEVGLYLSLDGAKSWQNFQLNLPITPIHDLKVKDKDLVVATHGRAFWILDDLSPLYDYKDSLLKQDAHLFSPSASERILPKVFEGGFGDAPGKNYMGTLGVVAAYTVDSSPEGIKSRHYLDTGQNPPRGVLIRYYLKEEPKEPIALHISDGGQVLRSFSSLSDKEKLEGLDKARNDIALGAKAGWNSLIWDMRLKPASKIKGSDTAAEFAMAGPMVTPGQYQLKLSVKGKNYQQEVEIFAEHGTTASPRDLKAQFKLHKSIYDKTNEAINTVNEMRALREQLKLWMSRSEDELKSSLESLQEAVLTLEKKLIVPDLRPGWGDTNNNGIRLLAKLQALGSIVGIGDYKPTDASKEVYEHLASQIDAVIKDFKSFKAKELKGVSKLLNKHKFKAL
ncbi:MAG: hypothetical protein R2880_14140 [Deinococcales bacterium]